MTPSEELELKIFRFAESAGKANWRATNLPLLSNVVEFHEDAVLVDALMDLNARSFMEFREWSNERTGWIAYAGGDRLYFYREFQMRVPFSGRKYFERLERESKEAVGSAPSYRPESHTGGNSTALLPRSETPKAFVSHSTQDHAFVERFARDLWASGVASWYSGWEIKAGDSIRAKIEEGLAGCEFFIIVLSKNSISSRWVQTELDAATVRKLAGKVKKIIPIKIEECGELPPTLGALCWEDFSNQPHERALERVLDSIFETDRRPPLGLSPTSLSPQEITPTLPRDHGANEESSYDGLSVLQALAEICEVPQETAKGLMDHLAQTAISEVKEHGMFVIPGIGRLVRVERQARMGRNPATGEAIRIPAKTVVKFRVAKVAKVAIVAAEGKNSDE